MGWATKATCFAALNYAITTLEYLILAKTTYLLFFHAVCRSRRPPSNMPSSEKSHRNQCISSTIPHITKFYQILALLYIVHILLDPKHFIYVPDCFAVAARILGMGLQCPQIIYQRRQSKSTVIQPTDSHRNIPTKRLALSRSFSVSLSFNSTAPAPSHCSSSA